MTASWESNGWSLCLVRTCTRCNGLGTVSAISPLTQGYGVSSGYVSYTGASPQVPCGQCAQGVMFQTIGLDQVVEAIALSPGFVRIMDAIADHTVRRMGGTP